MSDEILAEAMSLAMTPVSTETESDDLNLKIQALLVRCQNPTIAVEKIVFTLLRAGNA